MILEKFQKAIDDFSAESDAKVAADIYLAVHTANAILMFPGTSSIEGHDAIRTFVEDFVKHYEFHFHDWTSDELVVSGDFAFHRFSGVAEMVPRTDGDTIRQDRKYMDIWRRMPDGNWLIARHMFNMNN